MKVNLKQTLFYSSLLMGLSFVLALNGERSLATKSGLGEAHSTETQDRRVDRVALDSQLAAIAKLTKLVNKYVNTREEGELLFHLAKVYLESQSIEFRITYAAAHQKKLPVNLDRYHSLFRLQIETLNRLISRFPNFRNMDQCLFMRGKAYEELENKDKARADYLQLVQNFPLSTHLIGSYMALAEMAITANRHFEAIAHLSQVIRFTKAPEYPFALYKAAWSYFNLKDYSKALSTLTTHIKYYDRAEKTNSNLAIRENSLMDYVNFYLEGNEASQSAGQASGSSGDAFAFSKAMNRFEDLDQSPILDRMTLRFAKILRSHRRDADLSAWSSKMIEDRADKAETMDIVGVLLEHQKNQAQLEKMDTTLGMIRTLYKKASTELQQSESYNNVRKLILDMASDFQTKLAKAGQDVKLQSKDIGMLVSLYGLIIDTLPTSDPRILQAHYNLAEIFFKAKQFDSSTQHYATILEHYKPESGLSKDQVAFKIISSRYESLRQEAWIPQSIEAKPLDQASASETLSKLPKKAKEWISWIDLLTLDSAKSSEPVGDIARLLGSSLKSSLAKNPVLQNYQFEANRAVYVHGSSSVGQARMIQFALSHPESKYAVASASLSLDTLIKSDRWAEVITLSEQLLDKKWDPTFTGRLGTLISDASAKTAEVEFKRGDFKKSIAIAQSHLSRVKGVQTHAGRAQDMLLLAAQSYLALNDKLAAKDYFSRVIESFKTSPTPSIKLQAALLSRAKIEDDHYEYDLAIADYKKSLEVVQKLPQDSANLGKQSQVELQKRLFYLQWVQQEPIQSCNALSETLALECDKFQALSASQSLTGQSQASPSSGKAALNSLHKATKGLKENRPIWSLYALATEPRLELHQQIQLIKQVNKGWDSLDPLAKLSLLPLLSRTLPQTFALARANLRREVPLNQASSKAITRRAEWIKEFESAASGTLQLPWNRIRSGVLFELSGAYSDFTATLEKLPMPKGIEGAELAQYQKDIKEITQPFGEKANELAEKAYQVASLNSVEDEVLKPIETLLPAAVQKQLELAKKKLPKLSLQSAPSNIGLGILPLMNKDLTDQLPLSDARTKLLKDSQKKDAAQTGTETKMLKAQFLKALFFDSMKKKSWTKTAIALQDLRELGVYSGGELRAMRGLFLATAGAKSEGLLELESAVQELKEADHLKEKVQIQQVLISHYLHSLSVEKSIGFAASIETLSRQLQERDANAKAKQIALAGGKNQ